MPLVDRPDGFFRIEANAKGLRMTVFMKWLWYDTIGQVRDLVAFANFNLLEADVLVAEMIEE